MAFLVLLKLFTSRNILLNLYDIEFGAKTRCFLKPKVYIGLTGAVYITKIILFGQGYSK